MCIPIFMINTETVVGPVDKNGVQSINLYTKNDVRKIIKAKKEDVDTYIEKKKEGDKKCILGLIAGSITTILGIATTSVLADKKAKATAWTTGIILGLASLAGFGYSVKGIFDTSKATEELEKAEIKETPDITKTIEKSDKSEIK